MNLTELKPHLIHDFRHESDLVSAIQEISQKFTINRERLEDYLKDPRLVAAYCTFYLTTNFPKLEAVLPWMPEEWLEKIKTCDLVDLGAGPGTFSLAWKNWAGESSGEVFQIETSPLMREQARKIWDAYYSPKELTQSTHTVPKGERPKLVVFGHSANEMGYVKVKQYLEEIEPEHILFIEPGTSTFFPEMLKIREYLVNSGFNILYPCPENLACPMRGTTDWCHQFVQVRHSPDVERLTQLLEKDRRNLPLIVHAYSRTSQESRVAERLVRVFPETKFSFEWEVCHDNHLEHYQVMKRGFSKSELKAIGQLQAGEPLVTQLEKEFEKTKRVKLFTP